MKIALFGNNYQAMHLEEVREFIADLRSKQIAVAIHEEFAEYLLSHDIKINRGEICRDIPDDASMAASIGGDGTFLRTAEWVGMREIPIMGINTGHLGYLTGFSFDDPRKIEEALAGKYDISRRITLKVSSDFIPSDQYPYALNEVSVAKGDTASMVTVKATINGLFLTDYQSDGLIVSTPTGSTAYNLSCGGPILEPTLDAIVLSPIAPHSLTLRPLVVDSRSELCLELYSRGEECHVSIDGRTFKVPSNGSEIKITKSPFHVKVVQPCSTGFPDVLRNKLNWGR